MKPSKTRLAVSIAAIGIILVSLLVMLLDIFVPLNIWLHPVLTFLFCLFLGCGVLLLILGFARRSHWFLFLSSFLIGLAVFYALSQYVFWWLALIIVGVVWAIFGIMSFMCNGSMTEDIALNKSADYKNYEQRKAEKDKLERSEPKEELPEIKSFKE